jgi:hypothetical protein
MRFADRMIRQIMFGEETIRLGKDALDVCQAMRGVHRIGNEFGGSIRPGMESRALPLGEEAEDKSK